jgi:hypothetical protein
VTAELSALRLGSFGDGHSRGQRHGAPSLSRCHPIEPDPGLALIWGQHDDYTQQGHFASVTGAFWPGFATALTDHFPSG